MPSHKYIAVIPSCKLAECLRGELLDHKGKSIIPQMVREWLYDDQSRIFLLFDTIEDVHLDVMARWPYYGHDYTMIIELDKVSDHVYRLGRHVADSFPVTNKIISVTPSVSI